MHALGGLSSPPADVDAEVDGPFWSILKLFVELSELVVLDDAS